MTIIFGMVIALGILLGIYTREISDRAHNKLRKKIYMNISLCSYAFSFMTALAVMFI